MESSEWRYRLLPYSLLAISPFALAKSLLRRARAKRQHLALVLDAVDHGELLLVELAVRPLHHFGQILVHDDVAGFRIDHDRAPRAVELPAEQRFDRVVA